MQNLLTRSISALVYVAIFLFAILFSANSYVILTTIFGMVCLWELSKIIQFKNIFLYITSPIIIYLLMQYPSKYALLILLIITLLGSLRLIYNLYSVNNTYPKQYISKLDVCIRYIILPFTFLTLLPFINNNYNPMIIIYILILIWVNDSFAYLVGRSFGKNKLFERVSPKKTIEGFIGGVVFAIVASFIISNYSNVFTSVNWIIIALIVSIIGTLGDLIESKFKRQANVKDSGTIMPGHGGLLDRLDSLLFVAPFVYLYIHYLV